MSGVEFKENYIKDTSLPEGVGSLDEVKNNASAERLEASKIVSQELLASPQRVKPERVKDLMKDGEPAPKKEKKSATKRMVEEMKKRRAKQKSELSPDPTPNNTPTPDPNLLPDSVLPSKTKELFKEATRRREEFIKKRREMK